MESILAENLKAGIKQPLIVCLGKRGSLNQVFLVVEGQAIEVRRGLISALDKLIKVHFIMDICYASAAHHLLHFIQTYIMNFRDEFPVCRSAMDIATFCKKSQS